MKRRLMLIEIINVLKFFTARFFFGDLHVIQIEIVSFDERKKVKKAWRVF